MEQCKIGEICVDLSDPQMSKKAWKTTFWPKYKSGYAFKTLSFWSVEASFESVFLD